MQRVAYISVRTKLEVGHEDLVETWGGGGGGAMSESSGSTGL
jgi:hypothetical protein